MNILLICPEFPDTFWSFKHALSFVKKRASFPPLGLLTMAALLPESWNLRLLDLNVTRMSDQDLEWADFAFVTAMTVQRASAGAVIRRCKEAGVKVVAGGPLFTAEPEHFPEVDHLILNEAEITLPRFLADLEQGNAQRVYSTPDFADMEESPAPRWDLARLKRYGTLSIQYSRGCPFRCEFCNVTALLGHRPRTKSAPQVVAELDRLYTLGWRHSVFFVDDNLIGNVKRLKTELLPALISWRQAHPGLTFFTEASINLADDPELMKLMVAAGFDTVFIGIETPSDVNLKECSKKQNMNRNLVADVKRIQQAGLQVQGGFILGFDNDTPSSFAHLAEFIQQSGIVTAMVGLLQAPPGTVLHRRMEAAGRLLGAMSGDNADGATNIVPVMDLHVLKSGYRNLMQHLYSPRVYYQRVRAFLREYPVPRSQRPFRFTGLAADLLVAARSAARLGVLGRERVQYWKLLFTTLVLRPRALPLAITFAIYGYHFRRIAELRGA